MAFSFSLSHPVIHPVLLFYLIQITALSYEWCFLIEVLHLILVVFRPFFVKWDPQDPQKCLSTIRVLSTHSSNSDNNYVYPLPSPAFSLPPTGAEIRSRGDCASAPPEAPGALGHRRDLPHAPWQVWVCVSLQAPSLRLSTHRLAHTHTHLELLDELFFVYSLWNELHICKSDADTHADTATHREPTIWVTDHIGCHT